MFMMRNNMYRQQQVVQQKPIPQKPKKEIFRMSLSFKDDEVWLYDILHKYSCPSGTVKDILKSHFKDGAL